MTALAEFYRDRAVLVTGHTGFKGGWLATWLARLGARVTGFALPPEDDGPSYFTEARVDDDVTSRLGDLRDRAAVDAAVEAARPEVVFHLAARSLVRRSYRDPVDTWSTNVMGTAHLLEALRRSPGVRAVVVVTSDKCYENREWAYAYRENDPLGGHDPYSASKGAQEILAASWRRSFFETSSTPVGLATARAGNVIGGGDWAEDRLLPDVVRALTAGQAVPVRSPDAVRPWQHVLEPLSAYLWLGRRLHEAPTAFAGSWNFGPESGGTAAVRRVVDRAVTAWGEGRWDDVSEGQAAAPHEARLLRLDCTRAATVLGWRPVLELDAAVDAAVEWYRLRHEAPDFDARAVTLDQIEGYAAAAARAGSPWAVGGS